MALMMDPAWQLGAFAFEADFIDAGQLGDALLEWMKGPDQPLVEILVERKSLQPEDLPLLRTLWESQLAAFERPTLRSGLGATLATSGGDGIGMDPDFRIHSPGWSGLTGFRESSGWERFQIENQLASGGLGSVSVALDPRLNRRVAFKEIHPRLRGDEAGFRRFQREAEITGALEHPAIVPVYESGFRADGMPYYAMRLISGRTLRESVLEYHQAVSESERYSSLDFRRLVGNLVAVCQGISYAHESRIIHRDIKPANIVIGAHGETMIIDWGLARRLDSGPDVKESDIGEIPGRSGSDRDPLTMAGTAIGTPGYLSPEQAAGEGSAVGPGSDIFSLGATLYFLLTGATPFAGKSTAETLAKAVRNEFLPPRSVRAGIPAPLEAVCLKAMQQTPTARYASAEDLRADLERWLADEPVSVLNEPFAERISRFARKNRGLSLTAAASLVLIAATAIVYSVLLNKQTHLARLASKSATQLAEEKSVLAEQERNAHRRADEQGQLALSSLHSVVWDIQRSLEPIAAAQSTRRSLLETALKGLEKVAAGPALQGNIDRNTMTAHNEIGMIYLLVGEVAEGECLRKALHHFEQAQTIAAGLAESAGPGDPQALRDLSIAWEYIGDVQLELGNLDLAEDAYGKSLETSQRLAEFHPDDPAVLRDLAFGWEKKGDLHRVKGELAGQIAAASESYRLFSEIAGADPANLLYQRDLTVALQKTGNLSLAAGDAAAAARIFRECLEMLKKQSEAGSRLVQPRDRSICHNKLGNALRQQGLGEEALEAFETGLQIARQIVAEAPQDRQANRDLSISLALVADSRLEQEEFAAARDLLRESLAIRQTIAAAESSSPTAQADLASVLAGLGRTERAAGNPTAAREHFTQARDVLDALEPKTLQDHAELKQLHAEVTAALATGDGR